MATIVSIDAAEVCYSLGEKGSGSDAVNTNRAYGYAVTRIHAADVRTH